MYSDSFQVPNASMDLIRLNHEFIKGIISDGEISGMQPEVDRCHQILEDGTGPGSDCLGWLHLPSQYPDKELDSVEEKAREIREHSDVFISIGIGGSYLGAKAGIEFLSHSFRNQDPSRKGPEVYFAGQNIGSDYLGDLLEILEGKDISLNVISKSGVTIEPALVFRFLKEALEKKYGKDGAAKRIIATTDQDKGTLKVLANEEGYSTFVIPNDVGGRFSVLTPVGLLPMAVAGIDIREIISGAREMEAVTRGGSLLEKNPAYLYATIRNLLFRRGKSIEILASFHPSMRYILEWWKQLFGESEGKSGRGIFPASAEFTTDLHSLGQWVQEGSRNVFETFIWLEHSVRKLVISSLDHDGDGLNYLAGKSLEEINQCAYRGTASAHKTGGVPNMMLSVQDRSARSLGAIFYFFERAAALSGYLLRVNPFDQPGVETYKKNMFILLNKPGFEKGA